MVRKPVFENHYLTFNGLKPEKTTQIFFDSYHQRDAWL